MSIEQRRADVVWEGTLAGGTGALAGGSGAFSLPVTWAARTAQPDGRTSPEELLAAHTRAASLGRSAGSIRMRPGASLNHSWIPVIGRLTLLAGALVLPLIRGGIAGPHGCERERPDDDAPCDPRVLLGDQQCHAEAEQRNQRNQ
jgi:hypothetical protein